MRITNDLSDAAVLAELGSRIARLRLNRNMTQAAMADEAGVSKQTLLRFERGHSVQMDNFIRILRVLRMLENFDALIPKPVVSPIQRVKMQGKVRQRASSKRAPSGTSGKPGVWTWGDE